MLLFITLTQHPLSNAEGNEELKVKTISTGGYHTCALDLNDKLRCWGSNNYGQLGIQSKKTDSILSPKENHSPFKDIKVTQVALGQNHSCVLTESGDAYCAGLNSSCQVGYDTGFSCTVRMPVQSTPILFGEPIIQIAAGVENTCAIGSSNKMKCWGSNSAGQLGNNGYSFNSISQPTDFIALDNVTQISVGALNVCALLKDYSVRCWGDNLLYETGYPDLLSLRISQPRPDPVPLMDCEGEDKTCLENTPQQISLHMFSTCSLFKEGQLKCWGNNPSHSLGFRTKNRSKISSAEPIPSSFLPAFKEPIKQISLGGDGKSKLFSCALFVSGKMKCWGDNTYGQLGYGDTISTKTPPSKYIEIESVKSISTGNNHTCAILEDDRLKCWGDNRYGQLGYGDTSERHAPSDEFVELLSR